VGMEGVRKIEKGIRKAIAENQILLKNMKCNLGNNKFKIELTNKLPVLTKQYLILKRILGKVVEKMKK
jgi:hypothetical protein